MRLSITIVFLIGTMVTTEVMCDDPPAVRAAKVCKWFEATVKRLEDGQTLKQNGEFLGLAIYQANTLLGHLSSGSTINRITTASGNQMSDNVVINQIGQIRDQLRACDDSAKEQVSYVFKAIQDVLDGNLQKARNTINESKDRLPCVLTTRFSILLSCYASEMDLHYSSDGEWVTLVEAHPRPIPTYYMGGENEKTRAIREWLRSKLAELTRYSLYQSNNQNIYPNIYPDEGWKIRFMECLAEIAQALVNPLPAKYFPPEGSKIIGRYSLQGHNEIYHRIVEIQSNIAPKNNSESEIEPLAAAVKSVLTLIILIFEDKLFEAHSSPSDVRDIDFDFNNYMDQLYELNIPSPTRRGPVHNSRLVCCIGGEGSTSR
jgi:hypothetical protein